MQPLLYGDEAAAADANVSTEYVVAEVRSTGSSRGGASQAKSRTSSSGTGSAPGSRHSVGQLSATGAGGGGLSRTTTASSNNSGGVTGEHRTSTDIEARAVHSPLIGRLAGPVTATSAVSAQNTGRMGSLSKEEWQVFPDDMYAIPGNKYTKAELTARTPWKVFLTNPVSRALLFCGFVYVSKQLFLQMTIL